MADVIAILEDDPRRIAEMRTCLSELLPRAVIVFFESAQEMISWLPEHRGETVLISLDHDLPLRRADDQRIDCGTGRQVADYLASIEPTCPVIVHSSNQNCAPGMMFALKDGGWTHSQVFPRDDVEWIRDAWLEEIRKYVRTGWFAQ